MSGRDSPVQRRYRRNEHAVRREIAGEILLVPIRGELAHLQRMFVLNPVGDFIWTRLDGSAGAEDLVAAIVAAFDVTPDQARADLDEFLGRLTEAGLAQVVGPEAPSG